MLHMHFLIRQLSTCLSPTSNKNKQTPCSCSSGVEHWWWAKVEGSTPFRNYCDDAYRRNITLFLHLAKIHEKSWFFLYIFLEKMFLFQVVILKINDFLYIFFCNIRLWKRSRHGLKIVYTVHKTCKKPLKKCIFPYWKNMKSNCSSRKSGTRLLGHPLVRLNLARATWLMQKTTFIVETYSIPR